MTWKIERRKSALKPAAVMVLATAGLGLLVQAANANPSVRSAALADRAGSQEAIEVAWRGGGRGYGRGYGYYHSGYKSYGRYGYYGYGYRPYWTPGYRPYVRHRQGWGYGGHHYFY